MVNPANTLAVLLGASAWPRCAEILPASNAFAKSAYEMKCYLTGSDGMALPNANVLDLFDTEDSPTVILERVGAFLRERKVAAATTGQDPPTDVLLYYTGHGGFTGPDKSYFLAVRTTKGGEEGGSSIRMIDLAINLKKWALDLRRFLILDCCFSASAYKEFQSAVNQAISAQLLDALPTRGTALLCSSSSRTVSVANDGYGYTMFSGALLNVLRIGEIGAAPEGFSLAEVGAKTRQLIHERHGDDGVRPEVHSPDERDGDVASIPFFPNKSLSGANWRAITELSQRISELQQHIPARNKTEIPLRTPTKLLVVCIIGTAFAAFGLGTIYFVTKAELDRKSNTLDCLASHNILIETCNRQIDELNLQLALNLKELAVSKEQGKISMLNHDIEELQHRRTQLEAEKGKADADKERCYYGDELSRPKGTNR